MLLAKPTTQPGQLRLQVTQRRTHNEATRHEGNDNDSNNNNELKQLQLYYNNAHVNA